MTCMMVSRGYIGNVGCLLVRGDSVSSNIKCDLLERMNFCAIHITVVGDYLRIQYFKIEARGNFVGQKYGNVCKWDCNKPYELDCFSVIISHLISPHLGK